MITNTLTNAQVPVLGLVAYSGTGKTTLLCKVLPLLRARGLRVALIKHAHHDFDIDHVGKDSYKLREVGANPVLIGSKNRWALMVETPGHGEPVLNDFLAHLDQRNLDLVLVEGFKRGGFPKIELHRSSLGTPLLYKDDASIIAVATDAALKDYGSITRLNINVPEDVAEFIVERVLSR